MHEKPGSKDLFLAVTHELLSPLHTIAAYADLTIKEIHRQGEKGTLPRVFELNQLTIKREVDQMVKMVKRLVELMHCELGQSNLQLEPTSVVDLMEEVTSRFQLAAMARGARIQVQGQKPFQCLMDEPKVSVILVNLVENAVKATTKGRIVVGARVNERTRRLIISVRDTGAGVSLERQEKIFDPFTKWAHADEEPERPSTGLGLAISRSLAEMMGGSITVESDGREGLGACFTLDVPLPKARTI